MTTIRRAVPLLLLAAVACSDQAPFPLPVSFDWKDCPLAAGQAEPWVAMRDGDGPWVRILAEPGNPTHFKFSFISRKGVIVKRDSSLGNSALDVFMGTPAELQSIARNCTDEPRTMTGTLAGYASNETVVLRAGTGFSTSISGTTAAPAPFSLTATGAALDLVARKSTTANGQIAPGVSATVTMGNKLIIRHGSTAATLDPIDFAAAEAKTLLPYTISVSGLEGFTSVRATGSIATPTTFLSLSTWAPIGGTLFPAGQTATLGWNGLSAADLDPNDWQEVEVTANSAAAGVLQTVTAIRAIRGGTNLTVALGARLTAPTITTGTAPGFTYQVQSEYPETWVGEFTQNSVPGVPRRFVSFYMSKAYLGDATTVTMAMPDLTALSGFQPVWLLDVGRSTTAYFEASTAPFKMMVRGGRGLDFTLAGRQVTYTP